MIRLLKCEYQKTRRRYIFVTGLLITLIQLLWTFHGNYGEDMLRLGWMAFLYQLPLANAVFLPLLSIIISSRLCDIEHKTSMLRFLAASEERGKIYDAKLIYGMSVVLMCTFLSWCFTIVFGYLKGFHGNVPIRLYLLYLLFTLVPTVSIYIFHHIISLLFKNQAVTFFAGIAGTFLGVFSMFLPRIPWLRRSVIWGYYGVLQFVGLFDWTKENRYKYAHFDVMKIDWLFFFILVAVCVIMYFIGKKLFERKEL